MKEKGYCYIDATTNYVTAMGLIDEVAQRDCATLRTANITEDDLSRLKDAREQGNIRICRRIIRPYGVALHDTTPMQTYFTRLLECLQNE